MLIVIVVLFGTLWLPYRIIVVYNSFQDNLLQLKDSWFWLVCRTMVFINSAINPIIYNMLSVKFRRAFRDIVCKGKHPRWFFYVLFCFVLFGFFWLFFFVFVFGLLIISNKICGFLRVFCVFNVVFDVKIWNAVYNLYFPYNFACVSYHITIVFDFSYFQLRQTQNVKRPLLWILR